MVVEFDFPLYPEVVEQINRFARRYRQRGAAKEKDIHYSLVDILDRKIEKIFADNNYGPPVNSELKVLTQEDREVVYSCQWMSMVDEEFIGIDHEAYLDDLLGLDEEEDEEEDEEGDDDVRL